LKPEDLPQRLIKALLPRKLRRKANRMYKFHRADYLIVSYPKCGRTWLRVVLSYYYVERYGLASGSVLDFANLHYMNREIPRIFFTHDIPHTVIRPEEIGADKSAYNRRNVVFLARDPRDVIVSMYFQRTRRDANYRDSLSDFVFGEIGGLDTLIRYYNIWADSLAGIENKLLIKYEDMRRDTGQVLATLLEFMGHTPDSTIVQNAVAASSFEQMKNMERNKAFNRSWLQAANVNDEESYKVRRGKVGGYVDYLDDAELERLNRTVSENLSPLFGY
jgi:hypothetical protein